MFIGPWFFSNWLTFCIMPKNRVLDQNHNRVFCAKTIRVNAYIVCVCVCVNVCECVLSTCVCVCVCVQSQRCAFTLRVVAPQRVCVCVVDCPRKGAAHSFAMYIDVAALSCPAELPWSCASECLIGGTRKRVSVYERKRM